MIRNRSAPPATVTPVLVYPDVRGLQVGDDGAVVGADVDAAAARAVDHGAGVVEELRTWECGERSCMLEDLGGHRWELSQTVRDVDPSEWGGGGGW